MSRLPPILPADMNPDQRELFDAIANGRRARYKLDDGDRMQREGIQGPFNAWLYAPVLGTPAHQLGEGLRFDGELSDRQREIVILRVAAYWQADFEWWAHARIAAVHGVEAEVIDAIMAGETPVLSDPAEQVIYLFADMLLTQRHVDDDTYDETARQLGRGKLVELTLLLGYYGLISMVLNTFQVEVPPGESAPFKAHGESR